MKRTAIVVAAACLALAGCGGSSDDVTTAAEASTTTSSSASGSSAPGGSSAAATNGTEPSATAPSATASAGGGAAGESSPAGGSSAGTAAAAVAEDAAARGNCTLAGSIFAPLATGLRGDVDLDAAVRFGADISLDPASTQAGNDAGVALTDLARRVSEAQAKVKAGGTADRATLQQAYTTAQRACAVVGVNL